VEDFQKALHPSWPLIVTNRSDITNNGENRTEKKQNRYSEWRITIDWRSAPMVNLDPTMPPPGVDFFRQVWSRLNRFRARQDQSAANLHRW